MEIGVYFFGIALLVASVFLLLDTQQNRRLQKLSRETRNVEPLFLLRATEQKLNTLNAFLYGQNTQNNMMPVKIGLPDGKRQALSARLSTIIDERNSGKISLQTYNGKLSELVTATRKIK